MRVDRLLYWIAALGLAMLPAGALSQETVHPNKGSYRLTVPQGSPLKLERFGSRGEAHFSGEITVTGTVSYGCVIECEPPIDEYLALSFVPDRVELSRLPRWGDGDMEIKISEECGLIEGIVTSRDMARLRSGKISAINKHMTVVLDQLVTEVGSDRPSYWARIVSIAKGPDRKRAISGGLRCG